MKTERNSFDLNVGRFLREYIRNMWKLWRVENEQIEDQSGWNSSKEHNILIILLSFVTLVERETLFLVRRGFAVYEHVWGSVCFGGHISLLKSSQQLNNIFKFNTNCLNLGIPFNVQTQTTKYIHSNLNPCDRVQIAVWGGITERIWGNIFKMD